MSAAPHPAHELNDDPIVCSCLAISASEIRVAGELTGCRTVAAVKACTQAGTGCRACHRRILAVLSESRCQSAAETMASIPGQV